MAEKKLQEIIDNATQKSKKPYEMVPLDSINLWRTETDIYRQKFGNNLKEPTTYFCYLLMRPNHIFLYDCDMEFTVT